MMSRKSGTLQYLYFFFLPSGLPQQNTFERARLQPGGKQVCSCILAHVVHFIPVLTSSLPTSLLPKHPVLISLSPLLENDVFCWPCALTPGLTSSGTVVLQPPAKLGGLDAASLPSQPASPPSQLWHYVRAPQLNICNRNDELLSFYGYFFTTPPPTSTLWGMQPELGAASRWQRHTEQRSSIKVTTWSDVTAAHAARSKAAPAPSGIRRLDGGAVIRFAAGKGRHRRGEQNTRTAKKLARLAIVFDSSIWPCVWTQSELVNNPTYRRTCFSRVIWVVSPSRAFWLVHYITVGIHCAKTGSYETETDGGTDMQRQILSTNSVHT